MLIWNGFLTKKLPQAYGTETFDLGIPKPVLLIENILRFLVFFLPLCTRLDITDSIGVLGLIIFLSGIICYFSSWIMLMRYPKSKWCTSIFGFTAPAYTPLIWLFGLSFMIESFYFNFKYSFWMYLVLSCVFIAVHLTHTILVFRINRKDNQCTQ